MSFREVLASAVGLLMVLAAPAAGQGASTDPALDRLRQVAQMPVAVDKVISQAGVDPLEVARVARALHDGGVAPATFNRTLHAVSRTGAGEASGTLGRPMGVGKFAASRLQDGLRGEALAASIRQHLRTELGVPAGGSPASVPSPVAQNYVPQDVQEAVERRRAERSSGSGAGPSDGSPRPGVGAGSPAGPAGAPGARGRR